MTPWTLTARGLAIVTSCTALLIIATPALAEPASGGAVIVRQTVTTPLSETGLTDDCRPGVTGTLTGTDVLITQSVTTSTGFHINGQERDLGRIDWSDGSFTLIDSVDRFAFNSAASGTEVFTLAHVDTGDFYTPGGAFQFRVAFHEVQHTTVTDGVVVRVDFTKGHFVGGC